MADRRHVARFAAHDVEHCRAGRDPQRARNRPVRLLPSLTRVDQRDQAGPQQHPHVEVEMAGIDTELVCELAIRDRVVAARPEHLEDAEAERVPQRLELLRLVENQDVQDLLGGGPPCLYIRRREVSV